MKKVTCIIICFLVMLTSVSLIAACGNNKQSNVVYYSVAVDGGTGSGKYYEGDICAVSATVPEGKQFMKWIKNGQEVSVNADYSFEVTENSRLIAVFGDEVTDASKQVCVITADGGIGGGGYYKGSDCTIKIPDTELDRIFKGWAEVTDGETGEILSAETTYTFTVQKDITLKAVYGDARLPLPDNSNNLMFNLNAGQAVIQYDRQTDGEGNPITAFVEGVSYIRIYVYVSPEDDAQPIGWFKMVQRNDGSAYFQNMDETRTHDVLGEAGNYYTPDGNTHNWLKDTISEMNDGAYSTSKTYYFATQAIGKTLEDGFVYINSAISGKGRGVTSM